MRALRVPGALLITPALPALYGVRRLFQPLVLFAALLLGCILAPIASYAQTDNSQFVSWSGVPDTMTPGQVASVSITFLNTGSTTWTNTGAPPYKLGTQNTQDNTTWGPARIALPVSAVAPGQTVTFNFNITAPTTPGTYPCGWQMISPTAWFPQSTPYHSIVVAAAPTMPANSARFIAWSGIPRNMTPGQTANVWVTMQNNGTATWASGGTHPHRLGSTTTPSNLWGVSKVDLPTSPVAPGQTATFAYTVTAPSTPGSYFFTWQMLQEGSGWLGDTVPNAIVLVMPADDAQFVSWSGVPGWMTPGQTANVSVTMLNTGTTTWNTTTANGGRLYRLASMQAPDNSSWGMNRVALDSGPVAPGQTGTFTFTITAPSTASMYAFEWQMVDEGVQRFGQTTPSRAIWVSNSAPTGNWSQFISWSGVPSHMYPGQTATVSVTMKNTGTNAWSNTGGVSYRLGSQNPQDNLKWGLNRVPLPSSPITSGQSATFTFTITAPNIIGSYNFQWMMLQDGVNWFGDYTPLASILISPAPFVQSLTLAPTTVVGGQPSVGTVTIAGGTAPAGGLVINLSSDAPSVASVPASVTLAAGQSSGTFPITTVAVGATTVANVSAVVPGTTAVSAPLTVTGATLATLSVNPTSVLGGQPSTGTVTISSPAPAGGLTITLSSNATAAASVPSSVTIPAGQTSGTFAITTHPVATATTAAITALLNGQSLSASLTVTPPVLSSLTVAPTTVIGGQDSTGTVTLSGAAPSGGLSVSLSSSATSAATTPSSVTVSAGQTTATFTVSTQPVAADTSVTLSAALSGVTKTATLTVQAPTLDSLTVDPASVIGGHANATGTATLTGAAPAGGISVTLSSDTTAAASVPGSVTIAAGQTSGTFAVTTSTVTTATTVTLTGTLGSVTKTATLSVNPVPIPAEHLISLTFNPNPIPAFLFTFATATISLPAPAGGLTVTLTSDGPVSLAPFGNEPTITIAEGETSGGAWIAAGDVSVQTDVPITATLTNPDGSGTSTAIGVLTIVPDELISITLDPNPVIGGNIVTGTVTIRDPAPAGGTVIGLYDQDPNSVDGGIGFGQPDVQLPATVTVPEGSTTASFVIGTPVVTAFSFTSLDRLIHATLGYEDRWEDLVILPPSWVSLTLRPNPVVGGNPVGGAITLLAPAPAGGLTFLLGSDAPGIAAPTVSAVTVPEGLTSAVFPVWTSPIASAAAVTFTADAGNGLAASTILSVQPSALLSFTVAPIWVTGGQSTTGMITLAGVAPTGGLVVALYSDNSAVTPPTTVYIPAGQNSVTFAIPTTSVSALLIANLTATLGDASLTTPLTVSPTLIGGGVLPTGLYLTRLYFSPNPVPGGIFTSANVEINAPAPVDLTVNLSTSGPINLTPLGGSPTITIPAGETMGQTIVVGQPVDVKTVASATASLTNPDGSGTSTVTGDLTILPNQLLSIALDPTSVIGGGTVLGTVTVKNAAPIGGTAVGLYVDDPNYVSLPSSVIVPEGETTASFTVNTSALAGPEADPLVTNVHATLGYEDKWQQLTILPTPTPSFNLSPNPIVITISVSNAGGATTTSGSAAVTVSALYGFSGDISLSATGVPAGSNIIATVQPSDIILPTSSGATSALSTLTVTVPNGTIEGEYDFTLTATSGDATVSVPVHVMVAGRPAAPILNATPSNNVVHFSWQAVPTATSYILQRYDLIVGDGLSWEWIGIDTLALDAPEPAGATHTYSYDEYLVTNGFQQQYSLIAVNSVGYSPRSNIVTVAPALPVPSAPRNLGAIPGDATVALTWDMCRDTDSYYIYRSTGGSEFQRVGSATTGSFVDHDPLLANGTSYTYEVTAANDAGESAPSNQIDTVPTPAIRTSAQVVQIAATFCLAIGSSVDTTTTAAVFPTPHADPDTQDMYWQRRWTVTFSNGIRVEVSDDSGTIVSYRNDSIRTQLLASRAAQAPAIAEATALSIAQAAIAASGLTEAVASPCATLLESSNTAGLEGNHIWSVKCQRQIGDTPYNEQYVSMDIEASNGAVENLFVNFPTPPAIPIMPTIAESDAVTAATSLLSNAGITGATFDSDGLDAVQPNAFWQGGSASPTPGLLPQVAWACYFVRANPSDATLPQDIYVVWINATTGQVIAGQAIIGSGGRSKGNAGTKTPAKVQSVVNNRAHNYSPAAKRLVSAKVRRSGVKLETHPQSGRKGRISRHGKHISFGKI